MSQRITFYTTLVQREKLDEWLEKQKSIGSFVLAIPIVPLVNISSMSFEYRVRRCMVLLELLYFNACSTVTKFNCNIEILKIWNIWNSIHNRLFQKVPLKKNIFIRNNTDHLNLATIILSTILVQKIYEYCTILVYEYSSYRV